MKKRTRLGAVLLSANLLLLAVSGWMLFQAYQLKIANQSDFHPILSSVHENEKVGQMRVPMSRVNSHVDGQAGFGEFLPPVEMEVREIVPGGGNFRGYHYDSLKLWLKIPEMATNGGSFDFRLYHYCEEDGFWYTVYCTSFFHRAVIAPWQEGIKDCPIPSELLTEPGKYMIEVLTEDGDGVLGGCTFQLPLEN